MQVEEIARSAVRLCRRRGADQAEALVIRQEERAASAFNQQIDVSGASDVVRLTLRIFRDSRGAILTGQAASERTLEDMIERLFALSRHASPDKHFGLTESQDLGKLQGDLKIYDPRLAELPATKIEEMALAAEAAVIRQESRAQGLIGANFQVRAQHVCLCTSHGFCESFRGTYASVSTNAVVENEVVEIGARDAGAGKESLSAAATKVSRTLAGVNLDEAAAATVKQLTSMTGARPSPSGWSPVVFSPGVARNLAGMLAQFCSGSVAMSGENRILGKIGEEVCSPLVTLVDDAAKEGGAATVYFDHEGVSPRHKMLIEDGVFKEYLLNSYYARALQRRPTGNAVANADPRFGVRPSNVYIRPGRTSAESIVGDVRRGFYVTKFMSHSVKVVSNWTQAVAGFWIEDGRLAYPVRAAALSMPFEGMFKNIVAVGDDLDDDGSVASPTLMMGKMFVNPLA